MMLPTLLRNRTLRFGTALLSAALVTFGARAASAQSQPGECSGGNCGTPNNNGGGCGCGCGGSILVNYTDVGQSYEQSDDSDHDGIDDALDNCPYVANPDQADGDGDGVGNVCDNCAGTPNQDQKANACGDIWSASSAGFQSSGASNNAGMVIGAACDSKCTAGASNAAPVTVSVAPSSGPAKNGASNTDGSSSSSGEVACSVRNVGLGTASAAGLVGCTLGLALIGVGRRRRRAQCDHGC